jgi:hypothetical protein
MAILAPVVLASCNQTKNPERASSAPAAAQVSAAPAPAASPAPAPSPLPPKGVPTKLLVALADPAATPQPGQAAAMSIARRIADCWESDQPPDPPVVPVELALNQDGSVRSVTILDKARFAADAGFRAAATAVTGAFFKCSPFVLPATSFAGWKSLALRVTPYHG